MFNETTNKETQKTHVQLANKEKYLNLYYSFSCLLFECFRFELLSEDLFIKTKLCK
jgi:hypothetical protein